VSTEQNKVPIRGSERHPLPQARVVGSPDPEERLDVTVLVRRKPSDEELGAVLTNMDARLPSERSYFDREELAAAHGADPDDLARVKAFAYEHNLDVGQESLARRTIVLSGTVADLSSAFGVELANYEYQGDTYRGRTGSIKVPDDLRSIVEYVSGFTTQPAARPHFRFRFAHWRWPHQQELPEEQPHAGGASFFPNEVAKLYGFPSGTDGSGQCIGIIELGGGFRPQDINEYFSGLDIPVPKITAVSVRSGSRVGRNEPDGNPNGADGEVMLDIEVAGAVAPEASIVVYFAPNTSDGFLNAVRQAVFDNVNKPSVISISWGASEKRQPLLFMRAFEQILQDAAAVGVTVCCASGDDGSSDTRFPAGPDGLAYVDHPASCPHALGCGGTQLTATGGGIASEVVWNDPGGGATGGGVSDVFTQPGYQQDVDIRTVNPGGGKGRTVPDVSGDAAPATGYKVLVDGQGSVIGGTSAVAPLWAGLIALLNQRLGKPVGFVNRLLYKIAAQNEDVFRDITSGNNTKNAPGYEAGQGYDACTGLGSPNGAKLLEALGGA
jgi:kumamolisin